MPEYRRAALRPARCQRFVAAEGIQLLGGIAYTWEHDQHLWVKRAMTGDLLFGTTREHREPLATIIGA